MNLWDNIQILWIYCDSELGDFDENQIQHNHENFIVIDLDKNYNKDILKEAVSVTDNLIREIKVSLHKDPNVFIIIKAHLSRPSNKVLDFIEESGLLNKFYKLLISKASKK